MNRFLKYASLGFAAMLAPNSPLLAQTLVGDQITVNRYVDAPTFQWQWGDMVITVAEGPTDVFSLSGSPNFLVNIDASSIYMDFGTGGGGGLWQLTESYVTFEGIDFSPSTNIVGLSLATNVPGLTISNLTFGADSIRFNYGGLPTPAGTYLNIQLLTAPVPEPAVWLLLGCGAILLSARTRVTWRSQKANL